MFEEFCTDISDYYDLYFQTDTFLLADLFENFRNKCLEIYELDPSYFLSALRLAWPACLKKNKCKFRIINRYSYVING